MTIKTDDMDLAGDIIQALASFLGIEVNKRLRSSSYAVRLPCRTSFKSTAEARPLNQSFEYGSAEQLKYRRITRFLHGSDSNVVFMLCQDKFINFGNVYLAGFLKLLPANVPFSANNHLSSRRHKN